MPVPDFQTLMLPILKLFAEGKSSIRECIDPLRKQFMITDEEAAETLQSGQTVLYNRAHWARTYLGKAGLLQSPKRGTHEITEKGIKFLTSKPEKIGISDLKRFSEFSEWAVQEKKEEISGVADHASFTEDDQTPEDAIQEAHNLINYALREELLAALVQVSPVRFENLILDLLASMGFGKGKSEYKRLTPATGDGGIDGVINEDALGLDAVYIQAKRYVIDNKVSRPDIQRFVGSLTGESATKGVFVTTSDFSKEAVSYTDRIQQRVVLINGKKLASLMIEHGVGVRTRSVFEIKSLDEDYFSDL